MAQLIPTCCSTVCRLVPRSKMAAPIGNFSPWRTVLVSARTRCARREDADVESQVVDWCERHLGASPRAQLFRTGHLSEVIGITLEGGRSIVIKVRPSSPRLSAVAAVQRHLHANGFRCPELLAGPAPLGSKMATAERLVPGRGNPPSPVPAEPTAGLLAALVEAAPAADAHPDLVVPPPWVAWDNGNGRLWPWPDDLDIDLNEHHGPSWIDEGAERVRHRLAAALSPPTIGHLDWEAQNLVWDADEPVLAHDWDSLAIRPESTVVGAAAAVYPSFGTVVFASIDQTEAFLSAYAAIRPLSGDEVEEAWAAGAWVLAYNAKKETLGGGGGGAYIDRAKRELEDRLRRAGA